MRDGRDDPQRRAARQILRRPAGPARRVGADRRRGNRRPARPERRRQDDDLLHHRRPDAARRRTRGAQRQRRHATSRCTSARAAGISYLPQEPSVFRKLTVEENILAILETLPLDARGAQERLVEPARGAEHRASGEDQGLHALRRRAPARRDHAARWSSRRRSCCSTSRSPASIRSPCSTSRTSSSSCKERGIGVLITDHNVRETLGICDRAYILNDGVILEEGAADGDRGEPPGARDLSGRALPPLADHGTRNQTLSKADAAAGDDAPAAAGDQDPAGRRAPSSRR